MNFSRERPEAFIAEISPVRAKEMLETSAGNRRLRGWYVSQLAAAMRRGEWRVTSQGIGFDTKGRLRDAHHRLNACIESKTNIMSVVVLGLSDDSYQVTDIGINRSYGDRLNMERRVAEVIRLGCQYAIGTPRPTIDQMNPFIEAGFAKSVEALVEYCGSTRKYYSSAPMKLAAVITIMNGGDAAYVNEQYRALCNLDFETMSKSSQALVRQIDSAQTNAFKSRDVLARGLKVFDKDRSMISKIQCSAADADSASAMVKSVLFSII